MKRPLQAGPSASKTAENHDPRAIMWASLTIAAFLIVFVSSIALGSGGILPFLYGMATMLGIMTLEGILRGRLWLFDDHFKYRLSDPKLPVRLLIFIGGFLLIIETRIIIGVVTNPYLDQSLARLIEWKQCVFLKSC